MVPNTSFISLKGFLKSLTMLFSIFYFIKICEKNDYFLIKNKSLLTLKKAF